MLRECLIQAAGRTAVCCVLAAAVLLAPSSWVEAAHWWLRVACAAAVGPAHNEAPPGP